MPKFERIWFVAALPIVIGAACEVEPKKVSATSPAPSVERSKLAAACSSKSVPITVVLPDELANTSNPRWESYTGDQPVTFGIPFQVGCLADSDVTNLRLFNGSTVIDRASFDVVSRWDNNATTPDDVRWLLIDAVIPITASVAPSLTLKWTSPPASLSSPPTWVASGSDWANIDLNGRTVYNGENLQIAGYWQLKATNGSTTTTYSAGGATGSAANFLVETTDRTRTVLRQTGQYVDSSTPANSIARYVTRAHFYRGVNVIRLYHTLIWDVDAATTIDDLQYTSPIDPTGYSGQVSVDGTTTTTSTGDVIRYQTSYDTVTDGSGTFSGSQVDGWVNATKTGDAVFVGLRWPWQQYPVATETYYGRPTIHMIGTRSGTPAMSLSPTDVGVSQVQYLFNPSTCGSPCLLEVNTPGDCGAHPNTLADVSPRGISKTYELTLWVGDTSVSTNVKDIFTQHPLAAHADLDFATTAALPSPSSPPDTTNFPTIERAIDDVWSWMTTQHDENSDFGTWNFGDVQWHWFDEKYIAYRYWLGPGKGWPTIPWLLWNRSGARKFLEVGEQNARHLMDIHVSHVPTTEELPPTCTTPPAPFTDGKIRGGMYVYSSLHWSYGPHAYQVGDDSEFLANYYYMTGYRRARDVLLERANALGNDSTRTDAPYNALTAGELSASNWTWTGAGGDTREVLSALREAAVLYEETRDKVNTADPVADFHLTSARVGVLKSLVEAVLDKLYCDPSLCGSCTDPVTYCDGYVYAHDEEYLLAPGLIVAARALDDYDTTGDGAYKNKALTLLSRKTRFEGSWLEEGGNPGFPSGFALGPNNIWGLERLAEDSTYAHTNDLAVLAGTSLAQAETVAHVTSEPLASTGPFFNGRSAGSNQLVGSHLRGWVATMAALEASSHSESFGGLAPSAYFNSALTARPSDKWFGRHVVVANWSPPTLDSGLAQAHVHFSVICPATDDGTTVTARVFQPDGSLQALDPVPTFTCRGFEAVVQDSSIMAQREPVGTLDVTITAAGSGDYVFELRANTDDWTTGVDKYNEAFRVYASSSDVSGLVHYVPDPTSAGREFRSENGGAFWFSAPNPETTSTLAASATDVGFFDSAMPVFAPDDTTFSTNLATWSINSTASPPKFNPVSFNFDATWPAFVSVGGSVDPEYKAYGTNIYDYFATSEAYYYTPSLDSCFLDQFNYAPPALMASVSGSAVTVTFSGTRSSTDEIRLEPVGSGTAYLISSPSSPAHFTGVASGSYVARYYFSCTSTPTPLAESATITVP